MKNRLKLNARQLCDLELILNGGFSPLKGFLSEKDYNSVLKDMRLTSGCIWPMPITLDVTENFSKNVKLSEEIELTDLEGLPVASLIISDIWQPDKSIEAKAVFGTTDLKHPAVNYLYNTANDFYVGGTVKKLSSIQHHDFSEFRFDPSELKKQFQDLGWKNIVAFQTRNPMHRAHIELTLRAAKEVDAHILIQPVVGMTKPGDVDYYTRVKCYKEVLKELPNKSAKLSLLPLAMRMAGPREALWHAIIRKNYGCTHFVVGRDHAGPGKDSSGEPFYGPYDAQRLVKEFENEIGIKMVPFQEMVYVEEGDQYKTVAEVSGNESVMRISGTQFRQLLQSGQPIPDWFSYPGVIKQLRSITPPLNKRGFTVFFTGLSGAGKSTLAKALMAKLLEKLNRPVTLLDGDLVRDNLSSELGFSKAHRDINIKRIGFVAAEITKHRGIAICAPIAPYKEVRDLVRKSVEQYGGFIQVYLSTPLAECERRDTKQLYQKARSGELKGFTGIDDPYEQPKASEVVLDTSDQSIEACVDIILNKIIEKGYLLKERFVFEENLVLEEMME
jgi:sulfate adenylyltransferase